MEHQDSDCLYGNDLYDMKDTSDAEPCKEWCACNEQCGGFVHSGNCYAVPRKETVWPIYLYDLLLLVVNKINSNFNSI